jgi:hypothetical protein
MEEEEEDKTLSIFDIEDLNGVKIYHRVVGKTGNSESRAGGRGRIIETEGK